MQLIYVVYRQNLKNRTNLWRKTDQCYFFNDVVMIDLFQSNLIDLFYG